MSAPFKPQVRIWMIVVHHPALGASSRLFGRQEYDQTASKRMALHR
jgi:hypothetical protein